MARARDPDRDRAFEIFKKHNGNIELIKIAEMLNKPPGTIRGWKNKDNWEERLNGTFQNKEKKTERSGKNRAQNKKPVAEEVKSVIENPELNDKQRLFCLYYSRSFNATRSYQKAYGCSYETALTNGPALLRNTRVRDEIMRLKEQRYAQALLRPEDIFQKYMDIAFTDITDYVTFGKREKQVIGMYGPVYEGKGKDKKPVIQTVSYVELIDSSEVDGTLISEIKQGKDGVSIKLPDRMKALQWLADHMDLATEEQKLRIKKLKVEIEKIEGNEEELQKLDKLIEAIDYAAKS